MLIFKFTYMKTCKKISISAILTLALAAVLFSPANTLAATPTLTLASASDGDSVQLTITGDTNSNVVFYYTKTGTGLQMNYLGKTSSGGSFSTSLSTASYGITGNTVVYVTVNGVKSNDAAWPSLSAASVLSLSQTSLVLPLGNSSTITAYNNGTNFIYLSSNSNPPVVNVTIDGNSITLKALNYGSTVVTVCAGTGTPSCASVYVTVQNTGGTALAFSQNNPTVASGQNISITVTGGTGTYTLLNNANPSIIQASLSGNAVALSTNSSSGSSSVTVCSSDMSSCGMINAVVGNVSSTGLTFSMTNPTMTIGQSLSITISGGAGGNYSVFSNTNTTAVSAYISNNSLVLTANSGGSATVTVCSSMGNCAPEIVTVNYNTSSGGSITLSQNNLWLLAGQASSITVSGGSMPYSVTGYSENILKASFNNNVLTVTGVNAGSASVSVCSSGGGCVILSVLVSGSSSSGTTSLSLSQSSLALDTGKNATVAITGNGSYFVAYNTSSSVASATITGSNIVVNALDAGSTDVSICQNGGQCAVLKVTVSATGAATSMALSQTSLSLTVGNPGKVLITGSGSYSVSKNTNSAVASAAISGSTVTVSALTVGGTNISICQTDGQCVTVAVTVAAAAVESTSEGWISCAEEKGQCQFSGSKTVRYGANGKYIYGTFSGSALCANAVFGDPIENVVKKCYYGGTVPEGAKNISSATSTSGDWTFCANEKALCSFSGYQTVRYGANGKYYYGSYLNGLACTNSIFGDPIENVAKECYYGGTIPENSESAKPAAEKIKFTKILAYGASGYEVKALQQRLKDEGFYTGTIDGKFLTSTVAAVKKYQKSKGITQTGNVGNLTMAALNK